ECLAEVAHAQLGDRTVERHRANLAYRRARSRLEIADDLAGEVHDLLWTSPRDRERQRLGVELLAHRLPDGRTDRTTPAVDRLEQVADENEPAARRHQHLDQLELRLRNVLC